MRALVVLSIVAFLLHAICGAAAAADPPLRIAAAASLREALDEAGKAYQRSTGRTAVMTYAASSALARQIEAKAPFDVFLSADVEWLDYLSQRDLIVPSTRRNLLGNALVLIAAKQSSVQLEIGPNLSLARALKGGKLAIANPDAVPAGKYAKAALENLGVWKSVEDRTARAENVRAAMTYVARGEAPMGIVYRTDALAEPGVRIVDTFPASTHPPITYPVAALRHGTASVESAAAFVTYLTGDLASAIWKRHGFTTVPE